MTLGPVDGLTVACDTETNGLNPWRGDRPFAFSFCNTEGKTGYVRWIVSPFSRTVNFEKSTYSKMKEFFENPKIEKVFHNAKFDVRMLEMIGIQVQGRVQDTMFAMHCLRTLEPTLALKPLCKKYLAIPDEDQKDLQSSTIRARNEAKKKGWKIASKETHGDKPVNADYWLGDPELCKKYCIQDSVRAMTLWEFLRPIMEEENVLKIYEEEMRLFWVTYNMEKRGVRIYPEVVESEIKRNKRIMETTGREIEGISPGINVDSPKQLVKYFYETKGYKPTKWTDNGNPSIDAETLLKLDDPLSKKIIEFKTAEKAVESFFGRFKRLAVSENGFKIIHPDFRQIGPVTGRFACREPNLQNVADPYGTRAPIPIPARMSFGPRLGYVWYHYDYKQMELWLFASKSIANETKMLEALLSGRDLPTETAVEMWGQARLDEDKRTGKGVTRIRAKLMLYGIIYGIGPKALAALNKITYDEAYSDLQKYYRLFPATALYMERIQKEARRDGFVWGPLGRKFQVERDFSYKAANYVVQGSSAQVLKRAMIDTSSWLQKSGIDGHLVMTIHDELAFEINKRHETVYNIKSIKNIMESYGKLFGIPKLPVDVERVKNNWMEKEEVEI